MAPKVLVHVGAPKTGTSFVQDLLFTHRDALAARGILYPADRFDAHFLAALDLMELPWGGLERQAVGAWDALADRVRGWKGTAIVSHEILATASRGQVQRALGSFGDAEVHIVYSARDLARQLPAEWQENVKHRRVIGYRDFLAKVTDPGRKGELASWFWGVQEVPDVLDRWGATLPPGQVHLVTVPKPAAPRTLLWERFAEVLGLDASAYDISASRANPSLGVPETVFLRRLNERVNGGVLANQHYREFVRELLAHQTLSTRHASARLGLPADVVEWATEVSDRWVAELDRRGYDVVGSLDELRPDPFAGLPADPDAPDEEAVADVAMTSVVTLLQQAASLRDRTHQLHEELVHAVAERDQARREIGLWLRAKRKAVRTADAHPIGRLAHAGYRRLRRR